MEYKNKEADKYKDQYNDKEGEYKNKEADNYKDQYNDKEVYYGPKQYSDSSDQITYKTNKKEIYINEIIEEKYERKSLIYNIYI